eukprot:359902_1
MSVEIFFETELKFLQKTSNFNLMLLLFLIAFFVLQLYSDDTYGFDTGWPIDKKAYGCLRQHNHEFVILEASGRNYTINHWLKENLQYALGNDMSVDYYIIPITNNASDSIKYMNTIVDSLCNNGYIVRNDTTIWIEMCGAQQNMWMNSTSANIDMLQNMIDIGQNICGSKVKFGLMSDQLQWKLITNDSYQFKNYSLWWSHYDYQSTYQVYEPFGGWYTPKLKQYTPGVMFRKCNVTIVNDWLPN